MLEQVIYWMDIVGTAADVFLLLRVLMLRLNQTYLFITLFCAVTVVLDAGFWVTGMHGDASNRLVIYSRFVMALVFPLAAWDVFEEVHERLVKYRRLHALRLISGLTITAILALVVSAVAPSDDEISGMSNGVVEVAVLLWAATATASGLFIWNMRREAGKQQIALPSNTRVFSLFFLLTLAVEIAQCISLLLGNLLVSVESGLQIGFGIIGILLASWCSLKLKKVSSNQAAQPSEGVS